MPNQPAVLTLTVSPGDTGMEELRIMIPMERVSSHSNSQRAVSSLLMPTSDIGWSQSLLMKISELNLTAIEEAALQDYGRNPVQSALQLLKTNILRLIEEEAEDGD